jgi:exopolyphosphatase/guanosine-5'-triphosphate,3'-diphosphate pyrophosphatase
MQASDVVPPRPPASECRAVIDIGTNSVKLLVAHVDGLCVAPILERGNQTRLGEGFFATRRLQPAAIARTADAVAAFLEEAKAHGPVRLRIVATAAAREAENRSDLLDALQAVAAEIQVEVITGQREAELAFRGVCSAPALATCPILVADVGGGSTELILGDAGQRRFSRSFPLGAVRLMESIRPGHCPGLDALQQCRSHLDAWFEQHVLPVLETAPRADHAQAFQFVGVGGTAAILACIVQELPRYDRALIEAARIDAATLSQWTTRLWCLPLEDRKQILGLPPERADIILTGCAIYEAILRVLKLPTLRPSTRGLRFAALLDD